MKYVDEYRDKVLIQKIVHQLRNLNARSFTFMEVCGGHTMSVHRFGLPSLLPANFRLLSGPGCPVCVTDRSFIDKAIAYAGSRGFTVTTFGDLIRVPGSSSTLEKMQAMGADVRIVFSPLDAVAIAANEPGRNVVFLAIGFETTAPGTAIAVKEAERLQLVNFFILCGHKLMPAAMEAIINGEVALDGFICPGHVSVVTGSGIYDFIAVKYGIGCVVTGFEPADILQAIYMLAVQKLKAAPKVEIQYRRAVTREGNKLAQKHMQDVFRADDAWWRGLGVIPGSGLQLNEEYAAFDIERFFPLNLPEYQQEDGCICGDILRGLKTPVDCKLFAGICNPENPAGACMVSGEGACQTYYRYGRNG
jgi:hydrogenase expression/formation protein HypD